MSWRDREGLRREVLRHVLPDRPLSTPFVAQPADRDEKRFEDEWATSRLAVQPAAIFGAAEAQTWPVAADDIEEEDAGTYYTDWVDIEAGPVAQGLFSLPGFELSIGENASTDQTATVYAEFFDDDDETETTDAIAVLIGIGAAGEIPSPVFFELSGGKTIVKLRWKIVAGEDLFWSLNAGSLTYYGRL